MAGSWRNGVATVNDVTNGRSNGSCDVNDTNNHQLSVLVSPAGQ